MAMRMRDVVLVVVALAVAGCGGDTGEGRVIIGGDGVDADGQPPGDQLPPGVRAQLDSGNAAYRAGDYATAERHYQDAARQSPELAAPWFGIYMAKTALGDSAGAQEAMARAQQLSPGMSAEHPGSGGMPPGMGGMPPGHPGTGGMPPGHPPADTPRTN
jgi:hypothetical protein